MSPTPAPAQAVKTLETPQTERRLHHRYPITLEIEYKFFSTGRTKWRGFGRTLNVSSRGVLFEAQDVLPVRKEVEILVDWPFLLDGVCPLKLVVRGRVVRSNGQLAAAEIFRYEIRTTAARNVRTSGSPTT